MSSRCSSEHQITTQKCRDALISYVDEAKPDPLAKNQILSLSVDWKPKTDDDANVDEIGLHNEETTGRICGTLTLSSEYISIMVHVRCQWKVHLDAPDTNVSTTCTIGDGGNHTSWNKCFQNELYFCMRATASCQCVSMTACNKSVESAAAAAESTGGEENPPKLDRKERSMSRKFRSGMIKRLRADPLIRRLLVDEDKSGAVASDGVLLCEALIQQNRNHDDESSAKCEERVNVDSESIEGIKNAILPHCEDNLDVLEMLLHMPHLPRSNFMQEEQNESSCTERTYQEVLQCLSRRAFLRILEDAMFDACEKEGEDDMLDDLNISDNTGDRDNHLTDRKQQHAGRSKKKRV
jgi:hypothetical protein